MTQAEIAPKQILTAIQRQDPSIFITASDIRNDRVAIRTSYLADRTPIEALLDKLSSTDWIFSVKKDNKNHIQCLFFIHKKQIELLLANPDILLMNCIYRINIYRLPLLYILDYTNL